MSALPGGERIANILRVANQNPPGTRTLSRNDEAFIEIAVAKRVFDAALGNRVLAFSLAKRKAVARVVADIGLLDAAGSARLARLARYRVARADDKVYAEVAVRACVLDRAEAAEALVRQRDLYARGRGFIRLPALFRAENRLSREQDRFVRRQVLIFEAAPKKACPRQRCRAVLLESDRACPTCGAGAQVANPSGSAVGTRRRTG
jgi:hypothetical protein